MRLDEKAKEKREEKGERVDDYVSLLTRARAREGNGYAVARRSDGGLSILTKHEDIRTAPVTAEELCRPATLAVSGGEPSIPSSDAGGEKMDGGCTPTPGRPDETSGHICAKSEHATIPHSEKATVATQGEATAPTSDVREDRADANAGGTDVARSATRAGLADPTSNTGEGAANTALPAKPKVSFRPNCQHPENCASGMRDHCWSCRRAMQKSEEMA
jgi:hypothetical protein